MWRREMDCLVSVCDYIVEFYPSFQNLPDGTTLEEILDGFQNTEFWYVDEGKQSSIACTSRSFRRVIHRDGEKWWLPVPCVPASGLPERSQKELQQKRECANQIHKAAMAINGAILAEIYLFLRDPWLGTVFCIRVR
ncbi:putative Rop guanine nucleotide exchange factor 3 [Cocos nucifera]|uniref:Putative Rop guanine nucleotide exchange factor 3 n=1 Tax=Cocos nucifera TaxID=13894 RepID=A0A8K0IFV7_COCNU|nr:putative Rop guanine nucleotide exchange factor 3 [Cocos nucifera]